MDTTEVAITTTPINLVTEMSLTSGQRYYLQNTGNPTAYVAERTASPGDSDARHTVRAGDPHYFTVGTRGVWVWARRAGAVTVSEA